MYVRGLSLYVPSRSYVSKKILDKILFYLFYRLNAGAPAVVVCKIRHEDNWSPPYSQKIKCEKIGSNQPDDSDDSDDSTDESGCGELSIKTDKNTVKDCQGDVCNFSCKNDGTPTVDKIECKKGKWNIPKAAKKKGIKCAAEDAGAAACR